jgi:hypothetical protein
MAQKRLVSPDYSNLLARWGIYIGQRDDRKLLIILMMFFTTTDTYQD